MELLHMKVQEILGHSYSFPKIPAPARKEPSLRQEQIVRERCQTVARLLWKQNPAYTTAELSEHPDIFNLDVTGGKRYQPRTVYDWIAEVDPRAQKEKIGRPAKRRKNNRNNLHP